MGAPRSPRPSPARTSFPGRGTSSSRRMRAVTSCRGLHGALPVKVGTVPETNGAGFDRSRTAAGRGADSGGKISAPSRAALGVRRKPSRLEPRTSGQDDRDQQQKARSPDALRSDPRHGSDGARSWPLHRCLERWARRDVSVVPPSMTQVVGPASEPLRSLRPPRSPRFAARPNEKWLYIPFGLCLDSAGATRGGGGRAIR
jgi:hypothetical protein